MFIPQGYTEKQVLEIIDRVVSILASKFRFGYLSIEDMKQEGTIIAIESLERFEAERGFTLDNFLYTVVHNGLFNFKRKHYARNDPVSSPHNETKKKLIDTVEIESEELLGGDEDFHINMEYKELIEIINSRLPMNLRADYIRMLHKVDVPKNRKLKLRQAILDILEDIKHD